MLFIKSDLVWWMFLCLFLEVHHGADWASGQMWIRWHRLQHPVVQMGHWTAAAHFPPGRQNHIHMHTVHTYTSRARSITDTHSNIDTHAHTQAHTHTHTNCMHAHAHMHACAAVHWWSLEKRVGWPAEGEYIKQFPVLFFRCLLMFWVVAVLPWCWSAFSTLQFLIVRGIYKA